LRPAYPVTATVSVTVPVSGLRSRASGVRYPGSGVRLLQRDQVNPVTVSVTVSVSVSVTGSDAPRARPSHFHAFTGGRPGHGVIPRKRDRRYTRHGSHPARDRIRARVRARPGPASGVRGPESGVRRPAASTQPSESGHGLGLGHGHGLGLGHGLRLGLGHRLRCPACASIPFSFLYGWTLIHGVIPRNGTRPQGARF